MIRFLLPCQIIWIQATDCKTYILFFGVRWVHIRASEKHWNLSLFNCGLRGQGHNRNLKCKPKFLSSNNIMYLGDIDESANQEMKKFPVSPEDHQCSKIKSSDEAGVLVQIHVFQISKCCCLLRPPFSPVK